MTADALVDRFFKDPVFETERMVAGIWHRDLSERAFEMYGDPRVTEHIGAMGMANVAEMRTKMDQIVKRNENWTPPTGSFPMFHKSSRALVGTAMIKPMPDVKGGLTKDVEVGWHLAHQFWGQGFASEFGRRLLEIGFNDLKQDVLWAVVSRTNVGSQNVAKRIGMNHVGQTSQYYDGEELELFEMRNTGTAQLSS